MTFLSLALSALLQPVLWLLSYAPGSAFQKLRSSRRERAHAVIAARAFRASVVARPVRWAHVASSGELEQAIPVLTALRATQPNDAIYVTYFSASGARGAELEEARRAASGRAVPWDGRGYMPFDGPFSSRALVRALAPASLLLVRGELWPWLLRAARDQKVSVVLCAAYLSAKTSLRSRRGLWTKLAAVACVDPASVALWSSVFPRAAAAVALGDPRIDRVEERRSTYLAPIPPKRRSVVFASLWLEDWDALEKSIFALISRSQDATIFLVPHEPSARFRAFLERRFHKAAVPPFVRWTSGPVPAGRVVLVDRVGVLAELYANASSAFIGGSFRKKVHNVLEPAVHRAALFTGPRIENSPEAQRLRDLGALEVVASGDAFAAAVERVWADPALQQRKQAATEQFFAEQRGAGARIAQLWLRYS